MVMRMLISTLGTYLLEDEAFAVILMLHVLISSR